MCEGGSYQKVSKHNVLNEYAIFDSICWTPYEEKAFGLDDCPGDLGDAFDGYDYLLWRRRFQTILIMSSTWHCIFLAKFRARPARSPCAWHACAIPVLKVPALQDEAFHNPVEGAPLVPISLLTSGYTNRGVRLEWKETETYNQLRVVIIWL